MTTHKEALTLARKALVRADKISGYPNNKQTITAIDEALSQPEQEPVAWMSPNKERLEFSRADTVYGSHTIPLYTTPPQRTWVGLNEREVDDCYDLVMFDSEITPSRFRIYQAIEAKLKEKNNA